MKNLVLTVSIMLLNAVSVLSQSVYMHEAQHDAEESGEFSLSGLVLLLIVIGVIWVINSYIKSAKEHKKREEQRILRDKSKRELAENKAIAIINVNKSLLEYIDNEEWRKGFIEATYDIMFGKPKRISEDMVVLKKQIRLFRILGDDQKFKDTIKKIGYISRLNYDTIIERRKEEDRKRELAAKIEKEKEENEKNKIVEVQGCLLQNHGKILVRIVGTGDIHIPEGVETIKGEVFKDSSGIISVILPASLKVIEKYAFAFCKLSSIEIPKGVERIEEDAFFCSAFEDIVFHNSMEYLPIGVFSTCRELKHIQLPSNLKSIPISAFEGCWLVKNFTIPTTVKVIGDNAFSGCQSITELQLPECLEDFGRHCFSQCYELKHIEIPKKIVGIPEMCFYDCIELKEIVLNDGLCCIMKGAFENNSNLKIQIPNTVSLIQDGAFCKCSGLQLIVPNGRKEEFKSKCTNCYDLKISEYLTNSDIQTAIDKEKIDRFLRLQKAKEEHDLLEMRREMEESMGIVIRTGNPTIDNDFDDSISFYMDDD